MKQTAVEWLGLYIKSITDLNCDEIIEQAKEMEKEQIQEAFINGEVARDRIDSIEYYEETYGK